MTTITLQIGDDNSIEAFHEQTSLGTVKFCEDGHVYSVEGIGGTKYSYSDRDTAQGALVSFSLIYLAGLRAAQAAASG